MFDCKIKKIDVEDKFWLYFKPEKNLFWSSFLSRVSITPHTMRSVTFIFACLALLFALCLADEVATQQQQQQQPPAGQQNVLAGSPDADTSYIFSDVVVEEGKWSITFTTYSF